MLYEQIRLPQNKDGTDGGFPPSAYNSLACGWEGNHCIKYEYVGTDTGMSDESGEMLTRWFCTKTEFMNPESGTEFGAWYRNERNITLFVNEQGDAYRSWKGKLVSRPVCNFHTGHVFRYKRSKGKRCVSS